MRPVRDVLFTDSWARVLAEKPHDKPTAMGTRFRYSDALNCSRRLVFDALGVEKSDPIDPAGLHVTTLGTFVHEAVQAAMEVRYPGCVELETKSQVGLTSGSADAVVEIDGVRYLFELKTTGGYAFDRSIGIQRQRGGKHTSPEGPKPSAIAQGALNALANKCDVLVIGVIAMEALSKQVAENLDLSMFERFLAEWHFEKSYWEPIALAEVARIEWLSAMADERTIPQGDIFTDEGTWKTGISPNDARPAWTCTYCPHLLTCKAYEAGIDVLPAKEEVA